MTEAVTAEATQTEAQTEAAAEADLPKGFDQARTKVLPDSKATETKVEEKTEERPAGNTQAKAEVVVEEKAPPKPLIAGMTEEQLKAALGKGAQLEAKLDGEVRKVFSKVGEINRTVLELKTALAAGGGKASTRKVTAEMLKRVSDELPGLGEALAADLSAIFESPAVAEEKAEAKAKAEDQGKPFDEEAFFANRIGPALEQFKAQANESAQLELLEFMHADYAATLKTPEFAQWLDTLPAEKKKEVVESPRAIVAGRAITEFKEWNAKAKKAQESKTKRLEGAITPKGGGAPQGQQPNDEDADLAAGFKKASRKA